MHPTVELWKEVGDEAAKEEVRDEDHRTIRKSLEFDRIIIDQTSLL